VSDHVLRRKTITIPFSRRVELIIVIIATVALAVIVGFVVYLYTRNTDHHYSLLNCVDRYSESQKINIDHKSDASVNEISIYCYNFSRYQQLAEEGNIRIDDFVFQRHESTVLLLMVVVITISGIVLAGLQLLASYNLATLGRGMLAGGAEIDYGNGNISFKSSVVGLVILAISFAFFLVYVVYVYRLEGGRGNDNSSAPVVPALPRQVMPFIPNQASSPNAEVSPKPAPAVSPSGAVIGDKPQ
jgi:H+/Cl- antiporter ClcA